ncbi:MAG: hypothetical protein HOK60_01475, partial [Planctomycetes bacterium]|nr:hypothetical protein [Planctomycetota bacterium]
MAHLYSPTEAGLHRTLWSRHADFVELLFPATCCIPQQVIRKGSVESLRSNPEETLPEETRRRGDEETRRRGDEETRRRG